MQRANILPSVKNVQNVFPVLRTHNIIVELTPLNVFVCSLYVKSYYFLFTLSRNQKMLTFSPLKCLIFYPFVTWQSRMAHSTALCYAAKPMPQSTYSWRKSSLFIWTVEPILGVSYTTKNKVLGWWWTVVPHSHPSQSSEYVETYCSKHYNIR